MPRPPELGDPDKDYEVRLRVPGWLKNDIVRLAGEQGLGLGEWCAVALWTMVREGRGLPVGLVGRELPSVVDQLRLYLGGERVLMPCGLVECGFVEEVVGGVVFCGGCGVRVG